MHDLIAEGGQVGKRWTWHGTHKADFQGLPPTGKEVTLQGLTACRIENGKMAELWWGYDELGVLQQL